jgi:hypothetical protein
MQNFSSLASILDNFLTFYQEKFIIFQTIFVRISKNSKSEYAKFQLSIIYLTNFDKFFTFFQEKFRVFQKKILSKFQKLRGINLSEIPNSLRE